MKLSLYFGLVATAVSATAYELVWYTGQQCTGQRVWSFDLNKDNKNACHDVDQAGLYVPSMTMDPNDGEGEDDCKFSSVSFTVCVDVCCIGVIIWLLTSFTDVVLYSGKDCGGDLVGRGQEGCIKFEDHDVLSFQFVTFAKH